MKSKLLSAVLLLIVIIGLCVSYSYRSEWWAFIDIFCFFLATFLHLLAVMQPKPLWSASRKIDFVAMIFLFGGVASLIGESIAYGIILSR